MFFTRDGKIRPYGKRGGAKDISPPEHEVDELTRRLKEFAELIKPLQGKQTAFEAVVDLEVSITYYYDAFEDINNTKGIRKTATREELDSFAIIFQKRIERVRRIFALGYKEKGVESTTKIIKAVAAPVVEPTEYSPVQSSDDLRLSIMPGSAAPEEIAEILDDISRLYEKVGGSGIVFRFEGSTVSEEEKV